MHPRRFSCLLLGLWLAASATMTFLATDSANTADRILREHGPAASLRIKAMGQEEATAMLAYPVRQQGQWWLAEWASIELALGAGFFLFLLFGTGEGKMVLSVVLAIYALALFQRFFLLPQMHYLSNLIDFAPLSAAIPERHQFIAAQIEFDAIEIFKLLLGIGLGIFWIAPTRRSSHARNQIDIVDKSDYRHIDG